MSTETREISNDEYIEAIGPALERLYGEHMDKRDNANWYPMDFFTGELGKKNPDQGGLWKNDNGDDVWLPHTLSKDKLWTPDTERFQAEGAALGPVALSAVYIDGLTEAGVAHYTTTIKNAMGDHELGRIVASRWSSEEMRHHEVFYIWNLLSQAINPQLMAEATQAMETADATPNFETILETLMYTSMQEPATNVTHRNSTTELPKRKDGLGMLKVAVGNIAAEEDDHAEIFQGLATVLVEKYPNESVIAFSKVLRKFKMPGGGIPKFKEHSAILGWAGTFDPAELHNIALDFAAKSGILGIDPSTLRPDAAKEHARIVKRLETLSGVAHKFEDAKELFRMGQWHGSDPAKYGKEVVTLIASANFESVSTEIGIEDDTVATEAENTWVETEVERRKQFIQQTVGVEVQPEEGMVFDNPFMEGEVVHIQPGRKKKINRLDIAA